MRHTPGTELTDKTQLILEYIKARDPEPCTFVEIGSALNMRTTKVVDRFTAIENSGILLWQDNFSVGIFKR